MSTFSRLLLSIICVLTVNHLAGQILEPQCDINPHVESVFKMDISDDHQYILTHDIDGRVGYRHFETGKVVAALDFDTQIFRARFTEKNYQAHIIYIEKSEDREQLMIEKYDFLQKKIISKRPIGEGAPVNIGFDQSPDRSFIAIKCEYRDPWKGGRNLFIVNADYSSIKQSTFEHAGWLGSFDKDNNYHVISYDHQARLQRKAIDPISGEIEELPQEDQSPISYDQDNGYMSNSGDSVKFKDIANQFSLTLSLENFYSMIHDSVLMSQISIDSFRNNPFAGVNEFAFSKDGKYMSLATGTPTMFWSTTPGIVNEIPVGKLYLFDVKRKRKLWKRIDDPTRVFDRNVLDVAWLDDQNLIALNESAEIHKYHFSSPLNKHSIKRVDSRQTSLDIDQEFNRILYSVSEKDPLTVLFNVPHVDPIRLINKEYYYTTQVANNGTYSYCKYWHNDKGTNSIIADDTELYNRLFPEVETDGHRLSPNGKYAIFSNNIRGNYHYSGEKLFVEGYLYDEILRVIGIRVEGIEFYQKNITDIIKVDANGDEYIDFYNTGYLAVYDLENPDKNFIINQGGIEGLYFSRNERFINYDYSISAFEDQQYVETGYTDIFDLKLRQWPHFPVEEQSINNVEIDIHSDKVAMVLKDSTLIVWDTEDPDYVYINKFSFALPSGLCINSFTKEVLFLVDGDLPVINYQTGKESTNILSNVGEDIEYIEFTPKGDRIVSFANSKEVGKSRIEVSIYTWPEQKLLYNASRFDKTTTANSIYVTYNDIYFHKEKDLIFLYDGFGILELIDIAKGKLLATVQLMTDGSWLVYTPEGYFDASKKGRQSLYYLVGNEVILYDQIKEKYWETSLLDKLINRPHLYDSELLSRNVALFPTAEIALKDGDGIIEVKLKERNGGIGKVELYINDKAVVDDLDTLRRDRFTFDIMEYSGYLFKSGLNKVAVKTYNEQGWINSRPYNLYFNTDIGAKDATSTTDAFTATTQTERSGSHTSPGLFGLFVGSSKYKNPALNLNYADKDADVLMDAFAKISQGMYDEDRVELQILTSESTDPNLVSNRKNILASLDKIASKAEPNDIIVLFFSGHGQTIDDDFYYLTSTAGNIKLETDATGREAVTISSKEINEALRKIKSSKQILILDACHSGQIAKKITGKAISSSQEKALEFLEDKMGIFVLASSEANQKSFEDETLGQGLLTYSLLLGMSGEAAADNIIQILRLLNYAADEAEVIGKQVLGRSQRPVLGGPGGNSFPIGFTNSKLKAPRPSDKILIGPPTFVTLPLITDPEKFESRVLKKLKSQGAIGASYNFTFVNRTDDKEVYYLKGTYEVLDKDLEVTWNIFKDNVAVTKEPMKLRMLSKKKSSLAKDLIEQSVEKIKSMEQSN